MTIDREKLARDLRQRAGIAAALEAFPNLKAIIEGRVSGQVTEWPRIRTELCRLVTELQVAQENFRITNRAYCKLDEDTRELRGQHFADDNGGAIPAHHCAECCHAAEVRELRRYKAATELALQQVFNMFDPPLVGTPGLKTAIVKLREALAQKVRVSGEG